MRGGWDFQRRPIMRGPLCRRAIADLHTVQPHAEREDYRTRGAPPQISSQGAVEASARVAGKPVEIVEEGFGGRVLEQVGELA